jgi:hypothetical protein
VFGAFDDGLAAVLGRLGPGLDDFQEGSRMIRVDGF